MHKVQEKTLPDKTRKTTWGSCSGKFTYYLDKQFPLLQKRKNYHIY